MPRTVLDRILPVPDDDLGERRDKYADGLVFRAIVSMVFLVMFVVLNFAVPETQLPLAPLVLLTTTLAAINVPYWLIGRQNQFSLRFFYLHWVFDLVIIAAILFSLGGIDLPYGLLAFMMLIVTSATFLSMQAALVVAVTSTFVTFMMVSLQTSGIVVPPKGWVATPYASGTRIFSVTAATVFYYIFAYLAGTLADRLKATNLRLRAARVEIEEQNRLLEDKVAARTHELASRNSEIEEFVHIVTHDLRNVSVGATETARLLLQLVEPRQDRREIRYANHLLADARRMNSMLSQLLQLFKIDEQAQRPVRVALRELVNEVVASLSLRAEEKRIPVAIEEMPHIVANPAQLRHVIANLLDNAIKYTGDKARPRITIACIERSQDWVLSVSDNGIGIPSSQHERIFQLYYRGANQKVNGVSQYGEGVGLAICKRMVERWGGRIWVESRPDQGTTISVSIPRIGVS